MSDFFTDCGTWDVMLGDCLERLQELPEGCADLVLIDPPYGTIKGLDLHNWTEETTAWDDALEAGALGVRRGCLGVSQERGRSRANRGNLPKNAGKYGFSKKNEKFFKKYCKKFGKYLYYLHRRQVADNAQRGKDG